MPQFIPIWKTDNNSSQGRPLPGFTLIELLIVICVMATVMLAVYSCFRAGMQLWQRCQSLNQAEFKMALGLQKLSSQLRQAVDFPPVGFQGSKTNFSFPALDGTQIIRVSFVFEPGQKKLQGSEVRYAGINQIAEEKTFIASLEQADFTYYYFDRPTQQYRWKEEWHDSEGIPLAVRIDLKYKGGHQVATVFIPIA